MEITRYTYVYPFPSNKGKVLRIVEVGQIQVEGIDGSYFAADFTKLIDACVMARDELLRLLAAPKVPADEEEEGDDLDPPA